MVPKIASSLGFRPSLVAASLCVATLAPRVRAADTPADASRAQTLFDEARELIKKGDYVNACPKLEESQKLDPGGGTLLNLGICRMREGRTATAFAVLSEARSQAQAAGRADRVATAERHLAELAPTLSRIVVRVGDAPPPSDLVVEIDGKPLTHAELGVAQPFDPGPHRVRASRPGYVARDVELTLGPTSDVQTVDVPPLQAEATPVPPLPPPVPPPAARAETAPKAPAAETRPKESSPNWLGYTLVGAGGAAIAVGSYFGVRAFALKEDSDRYYDGEHCTKQSCVEDWDDAKTAATVSNVLIGVGVASLGVGVYFLVSSPTERRASNHGSFSLRTNRNGATATGTFEF